MQNAGNQDPKPFPPYRSLNYESANVTALVKQLKPYTNTTGNPAGLYKNEVLMMINLRPTELMVLDIIVEELDERFTPEQQEEIVDIVRNFLGSDDTDDDPGPQEDPSSTDVHMQDDTIANGV